MKKLKQNMQWLMLIIFLMPLINISAAPKKISVRNRGNLIVKIIGFKNAKGSARIALYNSENEYATAGYSEKGALLTAIAPVRNLQASYTFKNLPFGEYGIKLFHDKDSSSRFRTNIFGIPSQAYGFSNNPPIKGGMPSYQQIKFIFNANHRQQTITLKGG